MILKKFSLLLGLVPLITFGFLGCSLLSPPPSPTTFEQRLSQFPEQITSLTSDVKVYWNSNQIPFIEAQSDTDAAFTLGLVHAHLRLGQMEVLKRVSQGRLSEMLGPFTIEIDEALKILGYGRAAEDIFYQMPEWSRLWLQRYVEGVNSYREHIGADNLPPEYQLYDLSHQEAWTVFDSITLSRLFGTDINWLKWFELLKQSNSPKFSEYFEESLNYGGRSSPSLPTDSQQLTTLAQLILGLSRSGSNSVVVSGETSARGAGLIANDPHLGFLLPNPWVIAGLDCPSFKVIGMMPVGLPVYGFGRTPDLAWGGTNLRGLSSDLVELEEGYSYSVEKQELKIRSWPDRELKIRVSDYGPVISDAEIVPNPSGKDFALRWMGHEPSDEITSLLLAMKAKTGEEFFEAFKGFSIPGQNFLYVDKLGKIGMLVASHLPLRPATHRNSLLVKPEISDQGWEKVLRVNDLPHRINVSKGFIGSANNRPAETDYPIAYYYSGNDRIERINQLLGNRNSISLANLKRLQLDTTSPQAIEIVSLLGKFEQYMESDQKKQALTLLLSWSGEFTIDSKEAVLFVAFVESFVPRLLEKLERGEQLDVYRNISSFLPLVIESLKTDTLHSDIVQDALEDAWGNAKEKRWGDIHRLQPKFFLGNAPLIGSAYVVGNYPVAGWQETLSKSAGPISSEEHSVYYGAQSRHLSDMSDPDENYFVIIGGNDGWINSENSNDQTPIWLAGNHLKLPLSRPNRSQAFPNIITLTPAM